MLLRRIGGANLYCTEMLSSNTLVRGNTRQSLFLLRDEGETDLIHQISGADPDIMAAAAGRLAAGGVRALDINMGCSAPTIIRKGEGVALMREPDLTARIVRAVRRTFPGHLSAKIRLGWENDRESLLNFCRMLAAEGVQTLAVHPRFRNEKFKGTARWEWIRWLREELPLPVVGNGDVFSAADAARMRHETGCAGVMIGRGAVMRPQIFAEIIRDREIRLDPEQVLHDFIDLLREYLPAERQLSRLKIFTTWFAKSQFFGHTLFAEVQSSKSVEEAEDSIRQFFARVRSA
jgi:nifR3 family TIM-barrel protein